MDHTHIYNKMKIVVLDGHTLNPGDLDWDGLKQLGDLTVYDRSAPDEVAGRCKGAEIIFTNKTPLGKEILEQLPLLEYIGVLATGHNVVNSAFAKERGVLVANVPGYGTASVVQMT